MVVEKAVTIADDDVEDTVICNVGGFFIKLSIDSQYGQVTFPLVVSIRGNVAILIRAPINVKQTPTPGCGNFY